MVMESRSIIDCIKEQLMLEHPKTPLDRVNKANIKQAKEAVYFVFSKGLEKCRFPTADQSIMDEVCKRIRQKEKTKPFKYYAEESVQKIK